MRKKPNLDGRIHLPPLTRRQGDLDGSTRRGSAASPARLARETPGDRSAPAIAPRPGHWEHFPHDADVGIRGFGPTKAEAFAQAAVALTAAIADPGRIRPLETVEVSCRAPDDELLLVDWLNVLTYEMAARGMLFGEFTVEMEPGTLRGWARGERVDRLKHQPAVEVKGATLAELRVACAADGEWIAQCVIDV